mgnify:CR=1 FL=1
MGSGRLEKAEIQAALDKVRREERVKRQIYLIVATIVSLVVGGLIVYFALSGRATGEKAALTPPPEWNMACAPVMADVASLPTSTPEPLHVYVTGAVFESKVVTLPAHSLVADALEAVGGTTSEADLEALNLAAPLANHQQIVVPRRPSEVQSASQSRSDTLDVASSDASALAININAATVEQLETLPNIGATRAQQIIAYREEHGPFAQIEDIQDVSGIGPSIYAQIAPYITVEPKP